MKKKILVGILLVVVLLFGLATAFLWYITGGLLDDFLFDRPGKPKIKHGEFPFELVYEYNGQQFTVNETIVCDYEGISFSLEGGNSRDWNCYITNNDEFGRYYLDEANYPTLYVQVPLNAEYYMGAPNANIEFATPYLFLIDDSTGTTYYEEDLMDVVGAKIISWELSSPLEGNIK